MLVNLIEQLADQYADLAVVLTGGVFQIKVLLNLISQRFKIERKNFIFNRKPL